MPVALTGKTECLVLGNGPSLLGRAWTTVPRDRLLICGVNQSWRVVQAPDLHVAIDQEQYRKPEAADYYRRLSKDGCLYHTGGGGQLGIKLDRNDQLKFGCHPFRKRHRGATKTPPLSEDGGVAMKVDLDPTCGASSAYVALQVVVALLPKAVRYWIVGLDMGNTPKFTGEKSNSIGHDKLWGQVPDDVRERVRVIGPSATTKLQIVEWPWGDTEHFTVAAHELPMAPVPVPPPPYIRRPAPCW